MTLWGSPFAVRIHYPKRKGKRDLIKGMPSHGAAMIYARKVASRGVITSITGAWRENPIACVYDLKNWNAAPECLSVRPSESKKHPGKAVYVKGALRIRRVPYFGGFKKRRRR